MRRAFLAGGLILGFAVGTASIAAAPSILGKAAPDFLRAARLHLVETSPVLRRSQAAALDGHAPTWHEAFETLPDGPLITDDHNPLARLQLPIAEEHFRAMNELLPSAVWLN